MRKEVAERVENKIREVLRDKYNYAVSDNDMLLRSLQALDSSFENEVDGILDKFDISKSVVVNFKDAIFRSIKPSVVDDSMLIVKIDKFVHFSGKKFVIYSDYDCTTKVAESISVQRVLDRMLETSNKDMFYILYSVLYNLVMSQLTRLDLATLFYSDLKDALSKFIVKIIASSNKELSYDCRKIPALSISRMDFSINGVKAMSVSSWESDVIFNFDKFLGVIMYDKILDRSTKIRCSFESTLKEFQDDISYYSQLVWESLKFTYLNAKWDFLTSGVVYYKDLNNDNKLKMSLVQVDEYLAVKMLQDYIKSDNSCVRAQRYASSELDASRYLKQRIMYDYLARRYEEVDDYTSALPYRRMELNSVLKWVIRSKGEVVSFYKEDTEYLMQRVKDFGVKVDFQSFSYDTIKSQGYCWNYRYNRDDEACEEYAMLSQAILLSSLKRSKIADNTAYLRMSKKEINFEIAYTYDMLCSYLNNSAPGNEVLSVIIAGGYGHLFNMLNGVAITVCGTNESRSDLLLAELIK